VGGGRGGEDRTGGGSGEDTTGGGRDAEGGGSGESAPIDFPWKERIDSQTLSRCSLVSGISCQARIVKSFCASLLPENLLEKNVAASLSSFLKRSATVWAIADLLTPGEPYSHNIRAVELL
jgi:hypothetical protein